MADSRKCYFHILPSNDDTAGPEVVHCSPQRIEEIQRTSVIVKGRIRSRGNCEGIPLEIDDAADIDAEVLKYIVTNLPLKPGIDPGPIKLADLSKHCNAWWKYKWVPESAKPLWEHLDWSGIETQNLHGASPTRCWQQQTPQESQESSLYLTNIAIVLGLDDSLRDEMDRQLHLQIQNIVWNSKLDAQLKTSVDLLKKLEDMRLNELKAMFTYFFDHFVHLSKTHRNNVDNARSKLKEDMDVDFFENWSENLRNVKHITNYSVYEFVGKIESTLIGSQERHAHESSHPRHKVVDGPRKPREGPDVDWSALGLAAMRGTASVGRKGLSLLKGSHESKWNGELQQMFEEAHLDIQKSQKELTSSLIGQRNDELDLWKKALRDEREIV